MWDVNTCELLVVQQRYYSVHSASEEVNIWSSLDGKPTVWILGSKVAIVCVAVYELYFAAPMHSNDCRLICGHQMSLSIATKGRHASPNLAVHFLAKVQAGIHHTLPRQKHSFAALRPLSHPNPLILQPLLPGSCANTGKPEWLHRTDKPQ